MDYIKLWHNAVELHCLFAAQEKTVAINGIENSIMHLSWDEATETLWYIAHNRPYRWTRISQNQDGAWWFHHQSQTEVFLSFYNEEEKYVSPHAEEQTSKHISLKSPLAGRVIKVMCKESDALTKGDPLLIIEAMKMENEIRTPASLIVQTVFVQEGDVVEPGQLLVTLHEGEKSET